MKTVLILLMFSSALFANEPQSLKPQMKRFDKAMKGFESRLKIWHRCAKRSCTQQEREIAKKDLKRAGLAVTAIGVTVIASLASWQLYKNRLKLGVKGFEKMLHAANALAKASVPEIVQQSRQVANLILQDVDESQIKKMLESNPGLANTRVGTGLYAPHLYIVAIEANRPEIVDLLVDHGADITKMYKYRVGKDNVVTLAVKRKSFDTAMNLINKYTFDWKKIPDYEINNILFPLVFYSENTNAQGIFQKFSQDWPNFDEKVKSFYEAFNSDKEELKSHLKVIGYDTTKLE